eukprot:COSAG05_NODE_4368_length_1548_cov_1.948240_1_plen_469_part_10
MGCTELCLHGPRYTRNQWIDINVTHTVCNNDVCAAAMLSTAASLYPMMSLCRDRIGTDTHYWSASSLSLLADTCPATMVGARVTRLLTTCAAIGPGPGPGQFPQPAVPCSLECSNLIRSEKILLEDLAATPASEIDQHVLERAFHMLEDECSAAFPTVWFTPRYDRGLLFGVTRSGVGPAGTMLPRPGLQLAQWKGHGHDGTAPQPALMALDAATGRVYPVASLPIHEHTPGMVCFDEINQVYYLIGIRLANNNKDFRQTTHLLGVSVLTGDVLLDAPFPYRVVSMRYDNVKGAVLAVVMHSARPWDEESPQHVYDQRALVQVSATDGTITRVGVPALPPDEALSASNGTSVCARATRDDGDVRTNVAQVTCPEGLVIDEVEFASYGMPRGDCGGYEVAEACHAPLSREIAEASCLTLPSCSLGADTETWAGDPCPDNLKWAFLQVRTTPPSRHRDHFTALQLPSHRVV